MNSVVLSLEAFGGGESIGCIAATLDLDAQRLGELLSMADSFRNAQPKPIRIVFHDISRPRWFVENAVYDDISDFTQEADGYAIIDQYPGEANLRTDANTIHLTAGDGTDIKFSWHAVARDTECQVCTTGVPEAFLRELRSDLRSHDL